ncbi:MAG: hypothetical protein LIP12_12780 [Clostridiales bacterium]|nr:hypothetical protein [Clostridiales bacterium]
MENDMSRIIVETMVKKALKDLQDSPERSTRNLVDMALHFSEGRFQRSFFSTAQTMLENEQSSYYRLIKDIAGHVDSEKVLRFGMNIGYNSCTAGARQIRKKEETCGYNIPWTIGMELDPQRMIDNPSSYHSVITQGEKLGIYTWMLFAYGRMPECMTLMEAHPDDAFILFCEPEDVSLAVIDSASMVDQLMLAVRYTEGCGRVFDELRNRKLLYSAYRYYTDADVDEIVSGDFFSSVEQVHPVFSALIAKPDCSESAKEKVNAYVESVRKEQIFETVVWELGYDNSRIDSIISDEPALTFFYSNGCLYMQPDEEERESMNLFRNDLEPILEKTFKKGAARKSANIL